MAAKKPARRSSARKRTSKVTAKRSLRTKRVVVKAKRPKARKPGTGVRRLARPKARKAAPARSRAAAARVASARKKARPAAKRRPAVKRTSVRSASPKKAAVRKPAPRVAARPAAPPRQPVRRAAAKPVKIAPPLLDRERRTLPDAERMSNSPSGDDRLTASVRTGREELKQLLANHTEAGPEMTAGDLDARWDDAYAVGDEAPGGDNPTPDQDRVDDIGKALGVTYQDAEELKGSEKVAERDRHRWELDPASSDDWPHNRD